MSLSEKEITRYSRNILLPGVGRVGQEKLKASSITIVGAGGLGAPASLYLAAAGIGKIRIIDSDSVDLTNLQRQVLYTSNDLGKQKAIVTRERLLQLNPEIEVEAVVERITLQNIDSLLKQSDVILETSDNFPTKFLIHDFAILHQIPLAIGGILRYDGHAALLLGQPCYRCLFPAPPPSGSVGNCATSGVLGSIAGLIGSLQATMTLRHILGHSVSGKLHILSELGEMRTIDFPKNPQCKLCGHEPTIHSLTPELYLEEICSTPAFLRF